ncbi:hypothetical protein FG386_001721 [Cryptosporidium ryanae]|uniref:uncharacterized protein n=1 Tax=Cryptosporidium ryanae TaxID=515981 RepID=UPI00351A712E|nr:hypothetical protein FG386_001721 [Cryptosporidium ryanae]
MVSAEDIESFKLISGCGDERLARRYLEMFPGDMNSAINEYFSNMGNESNANGSRGLAEGSDQLNYDQQEDVRTPIPSFNDQLIQDYHQDSANSMSHYSFYSRADFNSESIPLTDDFSTQMFSPPDSIMFNDSFQVAKERAKSLKKLILVNIQNPTEFSSMILNRDIWNDSLMIEFIKEHFIFWQRSSNTPQGIEWVNLYNISKLPHVSVVDPRTGRQVKVWDVAKSFSDSITASSEIIEFLESDNTIKTIDRMSNCEQGTRDSSKNSVSCLPALASSASNASFNDNTQTHNSQSGVAAEDALSDERNATVATGSSSTDAGEVQIPRMNSELAMLHMERMRRKNSEKGKK